MRQRDISIDILKFLAVLAITNSHMGLLYGKYSVLATGGAIGDALFFFASGFTILLGARRSFGNYYKRRISRIYPTVFAWAVILALLDHRRSMIEILLHGGGWFVSCIMIYYVVLFFIRRYCLGHLRSALVVSLLVSAALYVPFATGAEFNMYGSTYYKWFHYFIFMLQGALMGVRSARSGVKVESAWAEALKAAGCIAAFYGLCAFKSSAHLNFVQVFSLLPLLGGVYYIYRLCNSQKIREFYNGTWGGYYISAVGGLCLEEYLVQGFLFTDKLNSIFPLNIPVVFLGILVSAYALRCWGRIWAQTFREADYQWREVFRLV